MVSVRILCVGKLKETYWREACHEYEKRLGAFCRCCVVEVAEERLPENPSSAQIEAALEAEGERLLAKAFPDGAIIAMCIEGRKLDSPGLAEYIARLTVDGISRISIIIGGSFGLSDKIKTHARLRLSMSPMTFPHQMARVMVLEQLYRSFQISAGGKYHK